ncbi:E3 Ubiquitin-Protein Ligase Arkadia [Manis pentadactyla]|nr:E3 Ubiquitin-Protein Ligase Arkadia [Manis pentadactyla]
MDLLAMPHHRHEDCSKHWASRSPSTLGRSTYPWSQRPSPHTRRQQDRSIRSRAFAAMQRFRPNPAEVVDLTADDDDDAHIDEIEEASSTAEVTARAEIAVTLTDSDYAETDVTLSDTEVETVTDGESHQSPSTLGRSTYPWSHRPSSHTHRPQDRSIRSRAFAAMQRFRPNPGEVVDLTADDDDDGKLEEPQRTTMRRIG